MDAILQTTFSNPFSWMKMFEFRLKFHWGLFLRFQLTIFQHWFRYWLGAIQATSHYLKQWWLVYWHIYASLGLNELIPMWQLEHSVYFSFMNILKLRIKTDVLLYDLFYTTWCVCYDCFSSLVIFLNCQEQQGTSYTSRKSKFLFKKYIVIYGLTYVT